jgi:hypothetical protein
VNDDGRREPIVNGLTELDADRLAGMCRDGCPASDIDAGWNYLPALPSSSVGFVVKKI